MSGKVPKVFKKAAKAAAKRDEKLKSKSLVEALRKQGKTITGSKPTGGNGGTAGDAAGKKRKAEGAASASAGKPFKKPFVKAEAGGAEGGKPKQHKQQHQQQQQQPPVKKDYRASKPNFQLVENLKVIWNKIRDRSTAANVRAELVARLVKQMTGKVLQVALRHDASRIVQCILQFGTEVQRRSILEELLQKVVEIAKTPYGHFCVLKAIAYCTNEDEKKKIVASMQGKFRALGTNVIGSRTVESLLQLYTPTSVKDLRAEFYGQNFTILLPDGSPRSLQALLQSLDEKKQSSATDHMRDLTQKFVDKGLLEFSYVHELFWEYTQAVAAQPKRMTDLVNQLADAAPKLISTKPGARVMCIVAGHAEAKERKRMLKSLKGKALESILHDAAHLAVMRLVDATDDTVTVQKMLLEEIKDPRAVTKYTATGELIGTPYPPLISIARHRFGSKLLHRLLAPQQRHLEPDEEALFVAVEATSRKAPAVKRLEHLAYLRAPLVNVTARYAEDLLRCKVGSRVLRLVAEVFFPRLLVESVLAVFSEQTKEIEVGAVDEDEDEDEEEEDEDEEDEEEAAGGAKAEGAGGDDEDEEGVEGEDEEEGEGEGEGEGEEEDDGDWGDEEEEDEPAQPKKPPSKQPPPAPKMLIQEDGVAHTALKQLVRVEAAAEKAAAADEADRSLWEQGDRPRLALPLFEALAAERPGGSAPLLSKWLECNRPCFALEVMMEVPSARAVMRKILSTAQFMPLLKASAGKHDGGKHLLAAVLKKD